MKTKLLLFLFIFLPTFLFALPHDLHFRHFSVENGLSSNCVRTLLQDKYGFIWAGTDEGLSRYDGVEFKSYKYSGKSPRGLNQNYILSLYEADNLLWVGTDDGAYCYNYGLDSFEPLLINGEQVINCAVTCITQDKDGCIWIATAGSGVYKYNKEKSIFQQYEVTACMGIVYTVLVDRENRVWAVSTQGQSHIFRLNKTDDRFEPFVLKYDKEDKPSSRSLVIFEDSSMNLWLGTWEDGLQRIDRYTGKITSYLKPSDGHKNIHIHFVTEYSPNVLMIGSDDGLTIFDTTTGESYLYSTDETNVNSLSNKFVYPIIKDREGGIWIGTYYGGINYISPTTNQFENYSHSKYSNSVGGNIIGRFCEDSKGNMWIASDDGGLNSFCPKTRKFNQYTGDKGGLSYHNVHALCMDGDELWIGTYTGGVNVMNTTTRSFKQYSSFIDDVKTLDGTSSYAIFKDREESIWVATMSGINLYNRADDSFIRVRDLGVLTIDIDQDTKGNIWFSTQGKGLFKYDPKKQSWKNYVSQNSSNSLPHNQVNCTYIDKDGQIWVGTMEGLCKYQADNDSFIHYPLDIPSNNIYSIIEDQNVFWLTTTKGLVRFIPNEGTQLFTKKDGLLCDQFLPNAAYKSSDGKIYIGSVNGFNAFYPYQIRTNKVVPPVVLTSLELFNKEVQVGDTLLRKSLNELETLELSYRDNVFSLRFASLSYCTPSRNQYAYILEGFDKEWSYVGTQNKATYTNLPAGTYTFRVKATNNDGLWNEQGKSIKIVIKPPFYLTKIFLVLYAVLIFVVFVLITRFFLKRSKRVHKEEIVRLNKNKEKEMHEAKIKFFTMIAHEIRTPVSLIIGPLEKIMQSNQLIPSNIQDDLNIIDRNSHRLLSLINQLLDFRKVEQEGGALKCNKQNICNLVKNVCERFEPSIMQDGARLITKYPVCDFEAVVDSEGLTKVVSNLLTNARKYMKKEIVLHCDVQHDCKTFTITVSDDGAGIPTDVQEKIFKPFFQAADNKPGTGIGLSIVKSIIEAHQGKVEVFSKLGQGSTFTVTLPLDLPQSIECDENEVVTSTAEIIDKPILVENKSRTNMLIVDDNEEILQFLSDYFSKQYTIITATNGKEALECLKKEEVSFIISDWMMPEMDGIELCKVVRSNQLTSHIPFMLLTAKTDNDSKVEGMGCGADIYIEKPFSINYLEACIRSLVDMRTTLKQKFSKMPLVAINSIAGNSADEGFLTKMNEIIEENFSNSELSVDFLAEKLCISRSGLFAKIKTLADITPNELIQLVRLKKAAALLLENKYRINEICYMVGFNNPSYFTKCFQKQFGVKPGEFNAARNGRSIKEEA